MTDTPLHELYNNYNSKKRQDVKGALHGTVSVNKRLAEQHVITESDTTRSDITENVFEKLTRIEEILGKRDLSKYLKQNYINKMTELQQLKTSFKEATKTNSEEEIVNDIIGG